MATEKDKTGSQEAELEKARQEQDEPDESAPRKAIADSLPPPDESGPGEQDHLDPMQRETADQGGR